MSIPLVDLSFYANIFSFVIGFPTLSATYYQAWKARKEAKAARDEAVHSANCLEFVMKDGTCINLVPLDTLFALPKQGDVVLLPGGAFAEDGAEPGAYRIEQIEHIYTRPRKADRPLEARLTKAIAQVASLSS